MSNIVMLKLGGSLITDKDQPLTPRLGVIRSLAQEISEIRSEHPKLQIILGHGSGSFGHSVARKYGTRTGVLTNEEWQGFIEVYRAARKLNEIIISEMSQANIPCMAFPPSVTMLAQKGKGHELFIEPVLKALSASIIPVFYGDVVFDREIGATILSTEDVFYFLQKQFPASQILLAGVEAGIWSDFPNRQNLVKKITPGKFSELQASIGKSASVDVTGGMIEKTRIMLQLIEKYPRLKIRIFSGKDRGNIKAAIEDKEIGTRIEWE